MRTRTFKYRLYVAISALIIFVLGASIAYGLQKNVHQLPLTQYFDKDKTNAVWDWSNPVSKTKDSLEDTAILLESYQINTIYLDISGIISIAGNEDGFQRTQQLEEFKTKLNQYISVMNDNDIQVFASAGDTDWSMPQNREIPLKIQQFVHDYNKSTDKKFAGLEFDIESYNQEGFPSASDAEKEIVLTEFLDTVDVLATNHSTYVNETNQQEFEIGFAIPYWFDNENLNIPSVSWYDKKGPVLYHLLDRLHSLNRSNVVVMAYRDAALGNDGIIYHSRTEIDYAQSKAPNVSVIIGAEITDVEPEKITFYGTSMTELSNEFELVNEEFKSSGVLGGIAINDLEGLRNF